MKISKDGIKLIKDFEGCKLYAYRCPAGVWTIGYGNTSHAKAGMSITMQQAEKFLREDLAPIEAELTKLNMLLQQRQFDALCSWIFNLGMGNFKNSTMRKKILAKATDIEVADQIIRWTKAGGKVLTGLQKRRIAEANMYVGYNLYYLQNGVIKKKK